ncbi:MAG: hypothetical protein AAGM38_15860 [Pseudomonadota bacterium]
MSIDLDLYNRLSEWVSNNIAVTEAADPSADERMVEQLMECARIAVTEARAEEREACARIAEHSERSATWAQGRDEAQKIAKAVRARTSEGGS